VSDYILLENGTDRMQTEDGLNLLITEVEQEPTIEAREAYTYRNRGHR
jgi:hypothetical protein